MGDKRRPSRTMWREWKKRAEVRRLTSFEKFTCVRENLVLDLILSFILSQRRDYRIGVMWWNLGVLVTARAAEFRTSWRRLVWVAGTLSRRELHYSILEWMIDWCFTARQHKNRSSNSAGSNLINSIANTSLASNIAEAWFRNSMQRYVVQMTDFYQR